MQNKMKTKTKNRGGKGEKEPQVQRDFSVLETAVIEGQIQLLKTYYSELEPGGFILELTRSLFPEDQPSMYFMVLYKLQKEKSKSPSQHY